MGIARSDMPPDPMTKSPSSNAFAVWITGLPASGKSTIVAALLPKLEELGLRVEVLESDDVRRFITPSPTYSQEERDQFYRALVFIGARLVAHGVSVIFDATANKRAYREAARSLIPLFLEVAAECPLDVCMARDRKGTYRKGQEGGTSTVPGLQTPYEPPLAPDLRIETTRTSPESGAQQIVALIRQRLGLR